MIGLNYTIHKLAVAINSIRINNNKKSNFYIEFKTLDVYTYNTIDNVMYDVDATVGLYRALPDDFRTKFSEMNISEWNGLLLKTEKLEDSVNYNGSFVAPRVFGTLKHVTIEWFNNDVSTLVHELTHFLQDRNFGISRNRFTSSTRHSNLSDESENNEIYDNNNTRHSNGIFNCYFEDLHHAEYLLSAREVSSVVAQTVYDVGDFIFNNKLCVDVDREKIYNHYRYKTHYCDVYEFLTYVLSRFDYILKMPDIAEFASRYKYMETISKQWGISFEFKRVVFVKDKTYYKTIFHKLFKSESIKVVENYEVFTKEDSIIYIEKIRNSLEYRFRKLNNKCSKVLTNIM